MSTDLATPDPDGVGVPAQFSLHPHQLLTQSASVVIGLTQNRDRPLDGCLKHPLGEQTAFEFLEHGGVRVDLWNRQVRRADARRRCHLVRDSPSGWTPPLEMPAIAHQTTAPCIWKPMQSNNTQTVHQLECACRPGLNGSVQQSPITGEA